jgi:Fe-S-cluster-containing dehydrogenase component
MTMERRDFLKAMLAAGGAAAVGAPAAAQAGVVRGREPNAETVGMLFDSTKCIGCKACVVKCREVNGLPPNRTDLDDNLHDVQTELNSTTKNVIKLYQDPQDASVHAFMKQQCMHCIEPACVSACMIGALHKVEGDVVAYDVDACVGCRYCQVACPFGIPKFEWDQVAPKIVKCELCKERLAEGKQPGCTEVCPRGAVIYGKLADLKADAHKRIADNPGKYQPKVYGEEEAGGTQVLYISAVPFEKLGLPKLDSTSLPHRTETLQHGVYQGFITPVVLYVGLAAAAFRNWRKRVAAEEGKS